jgi:hypothetical protein
MSKKGVGTGIWNSSRQEALSHMANLTLLSKVRRSHTPHQVMIFNISGAFRLAMGGIFSG